MLFLLALAAPFTAFFGVVQALPAQFESSIMGTVHHKLDLLQTTPGPRLILAGGSSSPYATNCEQLAEALGIPCINVGATAYLGADFYISMMEKYLQPGDIVVFAPEASMLGNAVDYETVWAAIENDPTAWGAVPAGYWQHLPGSYFLYAQDKIGRYGTGYWRGQPPYNPEFGPLGNVTAHREPMLESGYNRDDPIALSPAVVDDEVLKALNRFAARAEKQGATVLFAFAPVNRLAVTTPPEDWAALESHLRAQLTMPVLGRVEDTVMDGGYFYDSNNHLTTEGAQIYTERLSALLREELENQ